MKGCIMKKLFLCGAAVLSAAVSFADEAAAPDYGIDMSSPFSVLFSNLLTMLQSGFKVVAAVVGVALAAWGAWLIVKRCLPWISTAFGDLTEYLEDKELYDQWEADGKPYYIEGDDGHFKRVSAMQYEQYLLDRGYSPESARSYMREEAYNPHRKPLEVLDDDDDPDDED